MTHLDFFNPPPSYDTSRPTTKDKHIKNIRIKSKKHKTDWTRKNLLTSEGNQKNHLTDL